MNDSRHWLDVTKMILHHSAQRNGQGRSQKQGNQISTEWMMLIMGGGNGMKLKATVVQATVYG